jgi:hypothetical protein
MAAFPAAHSVAADLYGILMTPPSIRNRKLTALDDKRRAGKETVMLDIAFVALACAVLALMGVYCLALRRL